MSGSGLFNSYRIYTATVTATPTQLVSATGNAKVTNAPTTLPVFLDERGCKQGLSIRNTSATTVYVLSSPSDTTAAGYPLLQNESIALDVRDGRQVWLATASSTAVIAVWEL